jgi:hypothetical protein
MAKEKSETVEKKAKVILRFEDLDISEFVNIDKARRAYLAVFGGAKGGSAELVLAHRISAQNPGIDKEEHVKLVYKGLYGLLDVKKAAKNREIEKKDAKTRASR